MPRLKEPAFWPFPDAWSPADSLARELWAFDRKPLVMPEVGQAVGYADAVIGGRLYSASCTLKVSGRHLVAVGTKPLGCVWVHAFDTPADAVRFARGCLSGEIPVRPPPGKKFCSKSGFC